MFHYRPKDDECWEDNWLSNSMAWLSDKTGLSKMCSSQNSFAVKVVLYLWADCACCLSVRFFFIGLIVGSIMTGTIALLCAKFMIGV